MEKGKLSELKQYYPKTLGDNYTWIAEQDIETAKNLKNTLDKLDVDEKDYSIKKYYFENIFLDITDRTSSHPQIDIIVEQRKYFLFNQLMDSFVKFMGFGNKIISFEYDENFDRDKYKNLNWFDSLMDSHEEEKKQLEIAKKRYHDNDITFIDYWNIRHDIYNKIPIPDEKKYFNGVDITKYKAEINNILKN